MELKNNMRFVEIHSNSLCLFSVTEISFLILLLDQEYQIEMGYGSEWSQSYFLEHTRMSNATFTKCVNRLESIGVLLSSKNRPGEKKKYRLNREAYEKIILLLDTTNNIDALCDFCEIHFSKGHSIFDVTEEQLLQLGSARTV